MYVGQRNIFRAAVAGALLGLAPTVAHADVFLAGRGDGIFRYDDSGHFLGKHLTGFVGSTGLAFGPDGGLYVNENFGRTNRFDPVTGELKRFTQEGGFLSQPGQLAFGGPGSNLYVADSERDAVVRFNGTTGAFEERMAIDDLYGASGVAFDAAGTMYASSRSGVIYKNSTGVFTTFATPGPGSIEGLTVGPDGNLYAAVRRWSVVRYKPDGTPFGVGGSLTDPTFIRDSRLTDPYSINFGSDGNLYVVNQQASEVLRYSAGGSFMDTFIPSSDWLTLPTYMAFGSFAPAPGPVPEPRTWMLFALGLTVVGFMRRATG